MDGSAAKLPWRAAACLQELLEADGEVVPREELEQAVWGGARIEESNLAQCIARLRKVLDPAPGGGSHIETAARIGYRIAVRIEKSPDAGEAAAGKDALPAAPATPDAR